jgi:hypothetical protein
MNESQTKEQPGKDARKKDANEDLDHLMRLQVNSKISRTLLEK